MKALDEVGPKTMRMPYRYISAWNVVGGINHPSASGARVLYEDGTFRGTLTTDPDALLEDLDKGKAAANLLLRGLFNAEKFPNPAAEVAKGAEDIRKERMGKGSRPTILVTEGLGTCDVDLKHSNELPGLVLVMDGIDFTTVRAAHQDQIERMKLAIAFESEPPSRFEKVASGIIMNDDAGRCVYSVTFQMNARGYVSAPLTDEKAARVTERYKATQNASELASVRRLYVQMAECDDEPLKAFLFGWSALEIFVSKAFVAYEANFMTPMLGGAPAAMRQRFLSRVRDVMKDKYRLLDKFACVTAVLFEGADEAVSEQYLTNFARLKKLRDSILHGEAFEESSLPIHDLSSLLRNYVFAYLDRPR